jgi:hypothetical protein
LYLLIKFVAKMVLRFFVETQDAECQVTKRHIVEICRNDILSNDIHMYIVCIVEK